MLLNTPYDFVRQNERDLSPVTLQACWPASRRISMTAHNSYLKNNLTGTCRCNDIHSTHVAHKTVVFRLKHCASAERLLVSFSRRAAHIRAPAQSDLHGESGQTREHPWDGVSGATCWSNGEPPKFDGAIILLLFICSCSWLELCRCPYASSCLSTVLVLQIFFYTYLRTEEFSHLPINIFCI